MSFQLFDRVRAFLKSSGIYTHENLLQNQSDINRAVDGNELINYSSAGLLDQTNLQINRMERYKDYDQMDEMGEISLALDLYADESTQIDPETKHSIGIRAKSKDVKEELESLFFDALNIDKHIRPMSRYLCKYGDFAAEIIPNEDRNGVVSFRPFNIFSFLRVETKFGDLVGFFFTDEMMAEPIFLHPWQIMHQRLTSYENSYAPYGKSVLDGGRKDFRRLRLMEDAALIYRICLTGDSEVWTPDGHTKIKNMKQGDIVYTQNKSGILEKTKVIKQVCNGVKPVYKVSTKYHTLRGTSTHPFLVKNLDTKIIEYVDLKDLDPNIHLLISPKISGSQGEEKEINLWHEIEYGKLTNELMEEFRNNKYENITEIIEKIDHPIYLTRQVLCLGKGMPYQKLVDLCNLLNLDNSVIDKYSPFCKGGSNLPAVANADFCRFIGFYMGDGYISSTNWRVGLALGSDMDMNTKYISMFKKYHDRVKLEYKNENINGNKYKRLNTAVVCDKQLYHTFVDLKLDGGAHKKRIPEWIYKSPTRHKIEFIKGFLDADGTSKENIDGEYYEIELCNEEFIKDLKILCDQIGWITGKIRTRTREGGLDYMKGEYTSYILYINPTYKVGYEKIKSIEYDGKENVYDISVEADSHNFIANGLTVHNTRAPEKRVFTIPVGNIPTNQVQGYLNTIADQFKKQRFYDPATGEVNWRYAPLIQEDDFWLPQRPDGSGPKIDKLPGAENLDQIKDIEYFKKKMIAPLKIPFSRVGIGDDAGANADKSLASSHTDFAKAVQFVQKEIAISLKKIAIVHLVLKGYSAKDISNFEITMTSSSAIDELYRIETWNSRAGVISTLKDSGMFPEEWILERFTDMSKDEIQELKELKTKETKPEVDEEEEEAAASLGLPGLEDVDKLESKVITEYAKLKNKKPKITRYDDTFNFLINERELDGLPFGDQESGIIAEEKSPQEIGPREIAKTVPIDSTDAFDIIPKNETIEEESIGEDKSTENYFIKPLIAYDEEAAKAKEANLQVISQVINKIASEEMTYQNAVKDVANDMD